ncbi:MAG TPA: zinc-ribbon domain-containing protein [Bryobacteraceae bacterium]|nr:zinc-ribbon domain-containing protein [Bryobacteraceae bacterium]
MPFCTKCGLQVADADMFCANCGARQNPTPLKADPFRKVSSHKAAILCYIPFVGWVAAIIVLASARFRNNREVRFHAWQGLYIFVLWLLVDWVVAPMFAFGPWGPHRIISRVMHLALLGTWIFMLVKTAQRELVRLPILGELAERTVAEQQ